MTLSNRTIETGCRADIKQDGLRTTIAFTGHRPQRMGGFNPDNPTARWVHTQLAAAIERAVLAGFRTFIAGGALGFDTWAANAVLDQRHHLILTLPFVGFDQRWPAQSRSELAALIERTETLGGKVQYVSAPGYNPQKLIARDRWMIDRARAVIAGWDGGQHGGTWNAIAYARRTQRPVFAINSTTQTAAWM